MTTLSKGESDAIIVKYDLNGNIIWKKNFGGMDSDGFNDVIMANNGYVFVGFSRSKEDDLDGIDTMAWDALIFRSDLNGNR